MYIIEFLSHFRASNKKSNAIFGILGFSRFQNTPYLCYNSRNDQNNGYSYTLSFNEKHNILQNRNFIYIFWNSLTEILLFHPIFELKSKVRGVLKSWEPQDSKFCNKFPIRGHALFQKCNNLQKNTDFLPLFFHTFCQQIKRALWNILFFLHFSTQIYIYFQIITFSNVGNKIF